jgi:hypothetical protein
MLKRLLFGCVVLMLASAASFPPDITTKPMVWDGTQWVRQSGTSSGAQDINLPNSAGALSGLTFSQNNALGPTSFREDQGADTGPNTTFHRDSSVVMSTLGATRIGFFCYILPDTGGALGDSLNSVDHWYAFGLRANVSAQNDTGSAAVWLPWSEGGETVAIEGGTVVPRVVVRALSDTNITVPKLTGLYPGEFLIALHCARNAQSGWRYFEISSRFFPGGFMPDRFSFILRSMGHSLGGSSLIQRNHLFRTKVRVDVRGYR